MRTPPRSFNLLSMAGYLRCSLDLQCHRQAVTEPASSPTAEALGALCVTSVYALGNINPRCRPAAAREMQRGPSVERTISGLPEAARPDLPSE